MRRSGTIGVLIPQRLSTLFADPFLSELMPGLGELCEKRDLTMLLVPRLDGSLESAIRQASVDGFISLGLSPDDRALEMLDRISIPMVSVDSESSPNRPAVNVDDEGGAPAASQHLLDLEHRDVAIIVLPPTRAHIGLTPTAPGGRAFEGLPRGKRRPTGVLAISDMVAIGLMAAAQSEGLKVPDDLSVVGYDDLPMAAWTNPPLTTVRQPIIEKGRLAARLLIQRMKGKAVESPPPLGTILVVRGSTAPPFGGSRR